MAFIYSKMGERAIKIQILGIGNGIKTKIKSQIRENEVAVGSGLKNMIMKIKQNEIIYL